MNYKTVLSTGLVCLILAGCSMSNRQIDMQSGLDIKTERRIDSLLSLMTLKEKIGQLNQYSVGAELTGPGEKNDWENTRINQLKNGEVGSVLNLLGAKETCEMQQMVVENSRLGIPLLFSYDVVHGYKTIFPIPLGESASWDLEAMELSASIAAKEAASAGLHWTFAPMVDVTRDARWGRVMEGAGEDPYLGSEIARARVRGFQGDDLSDEFTIAACAKHFAGYGFAESGKDYNTVNIGINTLMNDIIPPFKAAEQESVATFMNAFNDIDGVPSTAHSFILKDVLKERWAFNGLVVSDWNSIGEIVDHGVAANNAEAAVLAINAGTDMDMEGNVFIGNLEQLVNQGIISETAIDDAVRRVLRLKFNLGLFNNPYKYCDVDRERGTLLNDSHVEAARDVARKSIVLLKNEKNLLPLKAKKIAIIGPLAKDKDTPIGNWRAAGESNSAVSLYEGLTNALKGKAEISYAEGCKLSIGPNNFFNEVEVEQNDRSGFAEAKRIAKNSDIVIMSLGETAYMSGEGRSRSDIGLPGLQLELLKEIHAVNSNVVLVLMNGRPLTIPWEAENIPSIVEAWHLGTEAGNAIADVLTGKYNPSGKLPMSFPKRVGQLPLYYNHKSTGRPSAEKGMVFYSHHTDIDNAPLYPFGYGIGYSHFEYSNMLISDGIITENEKLTVSVDVTNVGNYDGEEVVQLYIRDLVGSITRPVKELKGFKKVNIKAGETANVEFEISSDDLAFYKRDLSFGAEPGTFHVFVGGNSQEVLEGSFELIENQF